MQYIQATISYCGLSKGNKSSINVISQHFTGKNIHWQTVRENVASVSDVMIKGDKNPKGNMWKIKGCRGGVGVELEDVLVAWSVGPVPTKHLISLIKRTLAWYVLNSGDSGRVPSLHSPPLSHTHPDTAINHNNMRNKREKANSGQILKTLCFVIQQKQGRKLYLKHSRGSLSKIYLLSLTTGSPVCPLSLKSAFRVPSTEYPEC